MDFFLNMYGIVDIRNTDHNFGEFAVLSILGFMTYFLRYATKPSRLVTDISKLKMI